MTDARKNAQEIALELLHKDHLIAIILDLEDRDEYVEDCIVSFGGEA